jgi:3-hydroxyisobutyrate dehydrogenase-like beta-hydroxyacid dehydrogenase
MAPADLTALRPTAALAREDLSDGPLMPTSSSAFVGVVGLGHMGAAFALNLIADGRRVVAYDRDLVHVEPLRGAGAECACTLADLAACDFVLTSLPDDEALISVALDPDGLVHIMRPGAVHISMSTISPGLSRRLATAHEAGRQGYVAAPVLGNPDLARARHLFVLAAGKPAAVEQARPLLESLGQRLFVVGADASAGNLMKLAGNVLTATTLQSMGEVLALLRKGGIDQHVAFDILTNSLFDSKVHRTYGGKIVEERYSPAGMAVPLAIKDLRVALAEAEHEAVPMPVASLVRDRLVALVAGGWADLDWSALGGLAARDAGLAGSFDARPAAAREVGEV